MSKMLNILDHLANTNSRKNKEAILQNVESLDKELLQDTFSWALDPSVDYYIKEFDMPTKFTGEIELEDAYMQLAEFNARMITGNDARNTLYNTLSMLTKSDAEVLKRVVKRDLRCGVSSKTVNKIWPDLIYEHPYMRASSFSQKNLQNIKYPCISQTKMDGLYCDIIINDDNLENPVILMTRNGSVLGYDMGGIKDEISSMYDKMVLQGELLAVGEDGELMNRSLSNGYLNSDDVDESRLRFYCWDVIVLEDFNRKLCTVPYEERFEWAKEVNNTLGPWFQIVDSRECNDADEVLEHFKENRAKGEEGTIIKNKDLIWKDGTSKDQVKIKIEATFDLKIVGYKEGKGKFEGMIGSLECESSDGLVSVNVGGFNDATRQKITDEIESLISDGTIVEVKANDVITNQNDPDKYSLFLPRFVKLRTDKNEADSFERVNEQLQAYTDALKL